MAQADYDEIVANYDKTDAATTEMGTSLSAVAADITKLKDQISTSLTPEQVSSLKARATTSAAAVETVAASLKALDAENPEGTVPA